MLHILEEVESKLFDLIKENENHSMYIDYHEPYVKRIWFQYGKHRVFLHEAARSISSAHSLFHPHPRESAMRIISGCYEMGIGHSATNETPEIDCKLRLVRGCAYEMINPNGWHYINPITPVTYSIMVTGDAFNRKMPLEPNKTFRELTQEEKEKIMTEVWFYYGEMQ